jgi:hypothetical protein
MSEANQGGAPRKRDLHKTFGIKADHTQENEKEIEDFDLEVLDAVKILLGQSIDKETEDEHLLDLVIQARNEIQLLGEDTDDLQKTSNPEKEAGKTLKLIEKRIGGKIFKYLFLAEATKKFNNLASIVGDSSTEVKPEEIVAIVDSTKNEQEVGKFIMDTIEKLFADTSSSLELKITIQQILSDVYAAEPNALLHAFIMSLEDDEAVNQIFEDVMTK